MADDVTKKDLQGVEARLNKKIAELQKLFDEEKKFQRADSEELNKITVNVKKELDDRVKAIEPKITEFQNTLHEYGEAINNHAAVIKELQNKKTSIF